MISMELVISNDSEIIKDDVSGTVVCDCGCICSEHWSHCPRCGAQVGDACAGTCGNVGDGIVFKCSECGRSYIPMQIIDGDVNGCDWAACPGCGRLIDYA